MKLAARETLDSSVLLTGAWSELGSWESALRWYQQVVSFLYSLYWMQRLGRACCVAHVQPSLWQLTLC